MTARGHRCTACGRSYSTYSNLARHQEKNCPGMPIPNLPAVINHKPSRPEEVTFVSQRPALLLKDTEGRTWIAELLE